VQELLPEGIEVVKLRRDRPLNLSKDCTERPCTEVFEQVLKLVCRVTSSVEGISSFQDFFGEERTVKFLEDS
jgi:hypothetical protein